MTDLKTMWCKFREDTYKRKYFGFAAIILLVPLLFISNDALSNYMGKMGPYVLGGTLVFASITLWLLASIVVLRALFEVGATLSLMLFIAQSFCAVSDVPERNIAALQSLFLIGTVLVLIRFFDAIEKQLYGDKKAKPMPTTGLFNDPENKTPISVTLFTALFIGILLWQLYLVFEPIVSSTCVV